MIYARLHGRLGNQLFQYAAARGLAAHVGAEVAIDDRKLHEMGITPAEPLFHWKTVAPKHLPPMRSTSPLRYAAWRAAGRSPRFQRENDQSPDAFFGYGNDVYLHGYWQRPHYFADIEDDLRQELRFARPPSDANKDMADKIAAQPSVSIHARRGDFVNLGLAQKFSPDYYRAALELTVSKMGATPRVFIFSDDPDWARENLTVPYDRVIVDHNGPEADYEDLRLISLCDHNVICGSSFSWWGAWLNANPGKIVVGPGTADPATGRAGPKGWLHTDWYPIPADGQQA